MIRLEELLYSLTTVIVRYHDSLVSSYNRLISAADKTDMQLKSRALATAIIQNKEHDFKQSLTELIQKCTEGYPGRRPFLNFLLNEIILLHSFLNKGESFSPLALDEYKEQTFKLLMDFKGLLTTTKSKTYQVTQHKIGDIPEATISLSGCINDGFTGNTYCNSGIFLIEEVLDTLNIKIHFTEDKFRALANRICTEHQNALLVPELITILRTTEHEKMAGIESVRLSQQEIIDAQLQQIEELKAQAIQASSSALPDQSSEISRLEALVSQQNELAMAQEATIKELREQIETTMLPTPRKNFGIGCSPSLFSVLSKYQHRRLQESSIIAPPSPLDEAGTSADTSLPFHSIDDLHP